MRNDHGALSLYPFTAITLGINIVVFAVCALRSQNFGSIDTQVLLDMGASQPEGLWDGEWYRLVAPMFLHGGLLHILMNMYFLKAEGPPSEIYFGTSNFGTIYLLSGVTGICLSQIFGGGISVGASGSLCGIMGAHLAVSVQRAPVLRNAWRLSDVRASAYRILVLLAIGVAGGFMGGGSIFGRMDNWGHFGGALGGIALGTGFEMWRNRKAWGKPVLFSTLAAVALLVCAARWSVFSPRYHLFRGAAIAAETGKAADANESFTEALDWSRRWEPLHALGALNEAETQGVIYAFRNGGWNYESARLRGMKFIGLMFRRIRSDRTQ